MPPEEREGAVSAMSKQRQLAGARLVSDAALVLAAELGADAAARVLQDCEAQVRRHPPKRDVSTCAGGGSLIHAFWEAVVGELARLRPEAFGPRLAELGDDNPWSVALAYLYVSENHPDELVPFRATKTELKTFGDAYAALAKLPRAQELGWPAPPDDDWAQVVSPTCPLLGPYLQWQDFAGLSLCPHSETRQRVLLSEPRRVRRKGAYGVSMLLLHESIHGALASIAQPEGLRAYTSRLGGLVDEVVTTALEMYALYALGGFEADIDGLRDAVDNTGSRRAVLGLLSALPQPGRVDALGRLTGNGRVDSLLRLGVANLRGGTERATARALNRATGRDWPAADWLNRLHSGYEHYTVCWEDGSIYRYYGDELHGAPAVVRPDGYVAFYSSGELHRSGGPALIVMPGERVEVLPVGADDASSEPAEPIVVEGPAQLWFDWGRLGRDPADGPALIAGAREESWQNGRRVSPPAGAKAA
jgi:hypothetical protein